jgi:FlaA1/EpsC-like NDP-sugar epimerase
VLGSLLALLLFESCLIVAAVALGAWIRLGQDAWLVLTVERGLQKALLIAFVCQICLYYADLYNPRVIAERRELFVRAVQALGATSFLLAAVYYWLPQLVIGRGVFAISAALAVAVVIGWRLAFEWLVSKVGPLERILLVGTSPGAVSLARELHDMRGQIGIEIVGFIDHDPARVGSPQLLGERSALDLRKNDGILHRRPRRGPRELLGERARLDVREHDRAVRRRSREDSPQLLGERSSLDV